jgi:16S rRNA (uracil1498-N3)-methyltransferase
MRLFYNPAFNPDHPALSEDEVKHAFRVLRLSEGDDIYVINGKGKRFHTTIKSISKRSCELELIETKVILPTYPYRLHMAIAPTKNIDRLEWFLEKATEIGISEVTPVWCERSERKLVKHDRLEKILISAMKQSLQYTIPTLNQAISLKELILQSSESEKFIAHCEEGEKPHLKQAYQGKDVLILIGPEGDFSIEEIQLALDHGFKPISLGETRLRTETAALVANQIIHLHHA